VLWNHHEREVNGGKGGLEDRDYGSDIHSLINSALEVLPHNTDNAGYEEAISVLEKNDDKKYKSEQNQSNINVKNMPKLSGYIHEIVGKVLNFIEFNTLSVFQIFRWT